MMKKKNFLDYIPSINGRNTWDEKDGIVTINMVHRGFYHKLAQIVFKTPKISHISLDEFGSFVWLQIDGKRSVYDISLLVKDKFKEKAEPLYERIVKFFGILRDNRFVILRSVKNEKISQD